MENQKQIAQSDAKKTVSDRFKLSDYPEGNTDETQIQAQPQKKSVSEATDPSKLSDL